MEKLISGCTHLCAFLVAAALSIGAATAAEPIPDSAWGPPVDPSKGSVSSIFLRQAHECPQDPSFLAIFPDPMR